MYQYLKIESIEWQFLHFLRENDVQNHPLSEAFQIFGVRMLHLNYMEMYAKFSRGKLTLFL